MKVTFEDMWKAYSNDQIPYRKLQEGEQVQGVLVGPAYMAITFIDSAGEMFRLNAHTHLLEELGPYSSGDEVKVRCVSRTRPRYRYEVHPL